MKTIYLVMLLVIRLIRIHGADFVNLDFQSANTNNLIFVPTQFGFDRAGSISELLPGWHLAVAGRDYQGLVYFNGRSELAAQPELWEGTCDMNCPNYYFQYGKFGSDGGPKPTYQEISLWQIGRVPDGASELSASFLFANVPNLLIDGTRLAYRQNGVDSIGWDVSAYAGKEVKLEFSNLYADGKPGGATIDIIGFNVPEPSEWALLIVGGGVLWAGTRRRG